MIINDSFPKFDLPIDFIADDSITGDILNYYSNLKSFLLQHALLFFG